MIQTLGRAWEKAVSFIECISRMRNQVWGVTKCPEVSTCTCHPDFELGPVEGVWAGL